MLGAGVSGAVGEVELVSWMGAVGVMSGADWWWHGEADGAVGSWELVIDELVGAVGVWW
jgi:hypothetical protein